MVLSLLVCLIGGVVYVALAGPVRSTFAELGRCAFWVGLLAYLIVLGQHVIRP